MLTVLLFALAVLDLRELRANRDLEHTRDLLRRAPGGRAARGLLTPDRQVMPPRHPRVRRARRSETALAMPASATARCDAPGTKPPARVEDAGLAPPMRRAKRLAAAKPPAQRADCRRGARTAPRSAPGPAGRRERRLRRRQEPQPARQPVLREDLRRGRPRVRRLAPAGGLEPRGRGGEPCHLELGRLGAAAQLGRLGRRPRAGHARARRAWLRGSWPGPARRRARGRARQPRSWPGRGRCGRRAARRRCWPPRTRAASSLAPTSASSARSRSPSFSSSASRSWARSRAASVACSSASRRRRLSSVLTSVLR